MRRLRWHTLFFFSSCILTFGACVNLYGGESETLWGNRINITKYPLRRFFNLNLSNNGLSDLTYLQHPDLKHIQGFGLTDNFIKDISPLGYFDNLKYLELGNNQISDISHLRTMDKLSSLRLNSNKIYNIEPLRGLTELFYLDLSGNLICDISVINNLPSLKTVKLDHNRITTVPLLQNLTALRDISLKNNCITDISGISSIPSAAMISLGGNRLKLSQLHQVTESHEFFDFGHQYNVPLLESAESLIVNHSYKMGSEYLIGGVKTIFTVFRCDGTMAVNGLDYFISTKGEITFRKIGRFYIKMTNDSVHSTRAPKGENLSFPADIFCDKQSFVKKSNAIDYEYEKGLAEAYTHLYSVEKCVSAPKRRPCPLP